MPPKRKWVYLQRPKTYEMSPHGCGHEDPDWSEYEKLLWCPQCLVEYTPESIGVFDGPVPINCSHALGLCFDRLNLETMKVEAFVKVDGKWDWMEIETPLKARTFTETAEHFAKITKEVDWPLDEPDVD